MAFTRVLGPGIHTASNINSHNINSTGIITAVSFVGDGSGLTGVASTDNIITGTAATFTGGVDINSDLDVDGHTNLDNVSVAGVTTFSSTVVANLFSGSGASLTSIPAGQLTGTLPAISGANLTNLDASDLASGTIPDARFPATLPAVSGANLTGLAPNVGITTNLSGTFTASAGSASTINTLTGYSSNDLVVEYTIYIKNGSDFQTQKLLAMRDGTTIHSTQFAVMFSSSLLVQCDATISSGNILLRATPETGVSGSTTYKIKREVM